LASTEVNAVLGVTVDHRVHGAVNVQQHAVLAAPLAPDRCWRVKPPVM
jgi:hypothetical protein